MLGLLFICTGLALSALTELTDDPTTNPYYSQYVEALNAAKIPSTSKISKALTALIPSTPELIFDDEGRVLLTSAYGYDRFPYKEGDSFQLTKYSWFTAYPFLQQACQTYDKDSLHMRVNQLLGLSPTYTVIGVAEVYVDVNDIFRACPDPEVIDQECVVYEPVYNSDTEYAEVPWFCPQDNELVNQIGEKYSSVSEDHFEWMCNWWRGSYENQNIFWNYPWTALGYTYDWGSDDGIGLSEFVVPTGSTVIFNRKLSLEDYCS